MGDLTKNLSRREFACKCGCGFDTADYELVLMVQSVRDHFKKPVIINSGCRCEKHNKNVGGAKFSTHKLGKGADIQIKDISSFKVFEYLTKKYPDKYCFIKYRSWVHLDSRKNKFREIKG